MDSKSGGEIPTVESEILNTEKLNMRLRGCERKIALLQKEQTNLWKMLSKSYEFLNTHCDHEWSRKNQLYSDLRCSKCNVKQ